MRHSHALVSWSTLALVCLLSACSGHAADDAEVAQRALEVVAKRIDGFNAHDVDAYLSAHHENVEIYEYPDKKIGDGRAHLRRIFGPMLEQGIGEIRVENQVAIANTVVSEENVDFGGSSAQHLIAIYTVEDGVIVSLRLVESPD